RLRARFYSLVAVGWRGSAVQWQRWVEAYRAVALLGALLVIVLQGGASVELVGSAPPGRHDTLLPVTFLVGAVLSGVGVTAALVVAIRAAYGLGGLITRRHLDVLARMILVLGLASLYCHVTALLSTLLYGDAFAREIAARGFEGDLAWIYWTIVACGLLPVQVFWLPRARRSGLLIAVVGALVAIGAYADHVMVLVVSLQNESVPLPAEANAPGLGHVVTFAGSIGLFLALLLLVLRSLPIVSIAQTRQLAIAHNASEAAETAMPLIDPDRTDVPIRRIGAAFASEKALAAAVNALLGRDRTLRLDAFGPVPMPSVFEALRPSEHPIRRTALVSALAGGFGFLALCLAAALWLSPLGTSARLQASWPFFVLPSIAVALTTGTLAILVTLLVRSRLPQRSPPPFDGPGFPRSGPNRFRLTAEIRDGTDDAERVAQRLASLRGDGGRPLAIDRVPR
ncbi:quinol:electron acceptor oxidoreductase subunit ActD, partial [Methylobacterium haplocladii]